MSAISHHLSAIFNLYPQPIDFKKWAITFAIFSPISWITSSRSIKKECSSSRAGEKFLPFSSIHIKLVKEIDFDPSYEYVLVDMFDPAKVMSCLAKCPFFLFTYGLGPCIAVMAKCTTIRGETFVGLSHLYFEDEDFDEEAETDVEKALTTIADLDYDKMIKEGHFQSRQLKELLDAFKKLDLEEKITLFFAGGDGDPFNILWRNSLVALAQNDPQIEILGTYFNPFETTDEMEEILNDGNHSFLYRQMSLTAGISRDGNILLCRSIDTSFDYDKKILDTFCKEKGSYLFLKNNIIPGFKILTFHDMGLEARSFDHPSI